MIATEPVRTDLVGLRPNEARDLLATVVFTQHGLEESLASRPRLEACLRDPKVDFIDALRQDLSDQEVVKLAELASDTTEMREQFSITVRDADEVASVQWSGENRDLFIQGLRFRLKGYARKLGLPHY